MTMHTLKTNETRECLRNEKRCPRKVTEWVMQGCPAGFIYLSITWRRLYSPVVQEGAQCVLWCGIEYQTHNLSYVCQLLKMKWKNKDDSTYIVWNLFFCKLQRVLILLFKFNKKTAKITPCVSQSAGWKKRVEDLCSISASSQWALVRWSD